MDIQTSKLELVKLILNIDNPRVIDKMVELLKSEKDDFWRTLSEENRVEILLGIEQLDAGKGTTLEEFGKMVL